MSMNKKKGMSQTLALIVAASVLMMTALTVIFLAQNTLTGTGQDANVQACLSSVETQCQTALATSGGTSLDINVPQACVGSDGLISGVSGSSGQSYSMPSSADGSVTCG